MLASSGSGSSRLELDRAKARPMFCAFHHRFLRLYAKNCARLGASGTASLAASFGGSFWRKVDILADSGFLAEGVDIAGGHFVAEWRK